jgi:hypothetical protein
MGNKFWFILCALVGIGSSALAHHFGVPAEVRLAALFSVVLACIVGGLIGGLAGWYLAHDADVDSKGFKIIAWSGVIGWAIPIVGTTIATMTYMFKRKSTFHQGFYENISNIVGLLAVTNAMIGGGWAAYEGLAVRQVENSPAPLQATLELHGIDPVEMTGERSAERCQYAALEAWSREDFDRYCRRR